MQKQSIGIFLTGVPGSGKDYVLKNILSRFDLVEVQIDQVLTGTATNLIEQRKNLVVTGGDSEKIFLAKSIMEGYTFDTIFVSVTNKISRERNAELRSPIKESKRIDRFLKAEKMLSEDNNIFVFNNSINLKESTDLEKIIFTKQIEKLLDRVIDLGMTMHSTPELKTFNKIRENIQEHIVKVGDEYRLVSKSTGKNLGTYNTLSGAKKRERQVQFFKKQQNEAIDPFTGVVKHLPRSGGITKIQRARLYNKRNAELNNATLAVQEDIKGDLEKRHIAIGTPVQVVGSVVNSGHVGKVVASDNTSTNHTIKFPNGSTQQYHGSNLSLTVNEMQLIGTDSYREHAIAMTPGQVQNIQDAMCPECGAVMTGGNCSSCNNLQTESSKKSLRKIRKNIEREQSTINPNPEINTNRPSSTTRPANFAGDLGMPLVTSAPFAN